MQAETNESYLIFTIHKRLYAIKNTNVQEIMHSKNAGGDKEIP